MSVSKIRILDNEPMGSDLNAMSKYKCLFHDRKKGRMTGVFFIDRLASMHFYGNKYVTYNLCDDCFLSLKTTDDFASKKINPEIKKLLQQNLS
jgi:hypothetical protein